MIVQPSGVDRMCAPQARSASETASIRSDSFTRSSAAPRDDALAVRVRREQRHERQLVDEQRHLGGVDVRADERRVFDLHVADLLVPGAAAVEDGDAPAHPLEHVEQADAARVEADVVHGELAAGHERGGGEQRRRRREVAGNIDLAEPERAVRLDGDRGRTPLHPGARGLEHQLGVVARRSRLDHGGRACRIEPASSTADFTCALATGSAYSMPCSAAVPSITSGAWPSSVLTFAPIRAQRRGDALHRPGPERVVARQLEASRLPREDAREETDQRAGVPAVDAPGPQPAQA